MLSFVLVLLINEVSAIGVSPGKIELDFKPNDKGVYTFVVHNSKTADLNVVFNTFGEFSEYLTLETDEDVIGPEQSKEYSFNYSFPTSLPPGKHRTDIFIGEKTETEQGIVGAVAAVGLVFTVNVPYEGKYLETEISAEDSVAGDNVTFVVILKSLGKENINSITGDLEIYNQNNETLSTITFPQESIEGLSSKQVNLVWNSGNNLEGQYTAKLKLDYDNIGSEASTKFRLGILKVKILDLVDKSLVKGKINKVEVLTESIWNRQIDNAYAEVEFNGKKVRTDEISYQPWEKKTISSFADATDIGTGEYNLKVTLYFGEETESKDFKVRVVNEQFYLYATIFGIIALVLGIIILTMFRHRKTVNKAKKR